MFSTFNFEEPQAEPEPPKKKRRSRRDRSIKYLRERSAKKKQENQTPTTTTNDPSTSTSVLSSRAEQPLTTAELVAPVLEAQFPTPRRLGTHRPAVYYRIDETADPAPPIDHGEGTSASSDPVPGTPPTPPPSKPRRKSHWDRIRDRSPQIVAKDRARRLDTNKGKLKPRSAAGKRNGNVGNATLENGEEAPKTFGEVVKSALKHKEAIKTWISAMEHQERESDPEGDPTTTNAVATGEILPAPPVFVPRLTGWAQIKEFCTDNWYKLRYFYVTDKSAFFYYWTLFITIGVLYNMCAMCIFIFDDVHLGYFWPWLHTNLFFDVVFIIDMFVGSRMTFVHEGNEVSETTKMRRHYFRSPRFQLDIICLLPTDLLLIPYSFISLVRVVRMFKVYRLLEFVMLTQRQTRVPHFMKILFLTTSCAILFHWNACIYFFFSLFEGLSEEDVNAFGFSYYKVFNPVFPTCNAFYDGPECWYPEDMSVLDIRDERPKYMHKMSEYWNGKNTTLQLGNFSREYSMTIYWSALTITKCGQQPWPSSSAQNMLEIFDTLIGVLVFATIVGGVGSVVTQMSQNVNAFREMMDGIKFYMKYREVQSAIQERVLNCFLYLNTHNQLYDEEEILSMLPPRFQAEIATNLHQETLAHVSLFHQCDQRLLQEVVMLVKQQVYSPNDYLCRKNEKAKEMFIVKKGRLVVVDDDTGAELDSLYEGCTFGELSIIHVKGNMLGDRRSVSLRSVGYSDVYMLHQDDVTRLLQEYPEERVKLLENARKMLHAKGLLETNELGEMKYEEDGDVDEEALVDFMSVDEQLERLERIIDGLHKDLTERITSFSHFSGHIKQRVTSMEETYNANKKRIRSDLVNGTLTTDYGDTMILL